MTDVELSIIAGVATVTVDRPHARNAIGLATIGQFAAAIDAVEAAAPAVLVLRGGGSSVFVSGGDLKELAAVRTAEAITAVAAPMRATLDRLARLPMPVVAALNGHAIGGGAEVAVAADLRVAADDATIGFAQAQLAIIPGWGGAERLTQLVGRSQALRLLLTGDRVDAAEALRLGLVDVVEPRATFDQRVDRLAEGIAALPRAVSAAIKTTVLAAAPPPGPELEAEAMRLFADLWAAPEHWDAADAVVARMTRGTAR